jgi:hypothetical protein
MECHFCGKKDWCIKCRECGLLFCMEHKVPESHGCSSYKPIDPLQKPRKSVMERVDDAIFYKDKEERREMRRKQGD